MYYKFKIKMYMLNKNLKIDLVYEIFIIEYFYESQNLKNKLKNFRG